MFQFCGSQSTLSFAYQCSAEDLRMVDNLVHRLPEVNCLMDRCLEVKHKMKAVMAPYKGEYKDMQKRQSN